MTRRSIMAGIGLAALPGRLSARGLKADETVLFLPGYARELLLGAVEVSIEAWVFEFERRPGARLAFTTALGVDPGAESPETRAIFTERSRWFLTDSERGKELLVRFDGTGIPAFKLPATDRGGRVSARIRIPAPGQGGLIRFYTARSGVEERFDGIAHLVAAEGLSIISDIDDTIKISNVADTRALLRGSLMEVFKPAPGMATLYRRLAREVGASFHYLSSSPIQLAPALLGFIGEEDFPMGSLHLRESTTWNRLLPGEGSTAEHKGATLRQILSDFPARRFLLIGDSGEQDPELYGEAARAFPDHTITIAIREVAGSDLRPARFESAFAGTSARWHLIPESGPAEDWSPL
ncbi:phosphatidate phosphatase App1 family protein [Pseudogemmobacter bohemicus]|uniref:phosphatidate phosphatase App1 family protein n=1 Tax=Pseudogemmobacter bohemicus TaxID=2250708 RepID=UPI0013007A57|nr:App1 family protein [Pseudogemmobacter bohemicus]